MKSLVSRAGGRFGYRCNWVRSYARYRSSQSIISKYHPNSTTPHFRILSNLSQSQSQKGRLDFFRLVKLALPCPPPPHRHSDPLTVGVVSALNRDVRLEGREGVIGCIQADVMFSFVLSRIFQLY